MTIMAHPTQDMDISSSFISSDYLLSNNSSIQLYEKEMVMDENKDLEWLRDGPIGVSTKNYENRRLSQDNSLDTEISENIFPWLNKFNKLMRSFAGCRSYYLLRRLLSLYAQNVLSSINTYCERNLCEIKLKEHLDNTLIYFHLYWNDIKEQHVNDSDVYLNEMSVLLGIYIDMELRTFKPSMDSTKIASKLLSALWIFLCNSERHIFNVLLKLKFTAKKYSKIYDLLLMRSFKSLKKNMESLTDTDYVRYLLVLKFWQRMKDNVEEKKEVNKLALTILGPCIPKMRDELLKIVPKPPIGHKNETVWLLQPNSFDLNSACYNFVLFEETMLAEFKDFHLTRNCKSNFKTSRNLSRVADCLMSCELQEGERNNYKTNCPPENQTECHKVVEKILPARSKNKFRRHKNVRKLKAGEVIVIDLTEEDESTNKKEKRKRGTRELEWLKAMKKKCKMPKKIGETKCKNQVEIADAHSTGSSENFAEEILLEHLPISDNKVSESSESCTLLEQEKSQVHDHGFNKKSNALNCMFQQKKCDTYASLPLVETDIQCNRVLYLLKLLSTMGENIKEPRAVLNLLREYTYENITSCQHLCRNGGNESRGKQEFSQPESSVGAVLLPNECQSSVTDMQPIKQELPMNADCNMLSVDTYCQADFKSNNNVQVTESTKQKVSRDSHECCKKIGVKPFSYHSNIFNSTKNEDATQSATDVAVGEKNSICDKNIMCMLSDLDKCMDVLNPIGEHIMTVHAEKQRFESSEKDMCDVTTTVSGSQVVESSSNWIEKINSLASSEKLCKVIELCGKKDIFNGCNGTESHRCHSGTVSTSQPKEYRSHGNESLTNSEDRSLSFARGRIIKSEFDPAVKKESNESFQVLRDELQKAGPRENGASTTNQTPEYLLHDPKGSKELGRGARNFFEKDNATRTRSFEEFESVDILDNILNGDITLEDEQEIWEDTQSSLISPANYDNSSSVLNYIAELFSQSEQAFTSEGEEKYMVSDTENSQTPLPDGSLAAAGLLNSMFDFDLTNMDSPSNEFIYSSTRTVNPRLIKKNFADEGFATKSCNLSELLDIEQKIFPGETSNLDAVLLQREKELGNDPDVSIDSSVNVVGFGLNCSREEVLQFPSLNKNVSSFPGQSTVSVGSDSVPAVAKESFPKSSVSSLTDKFDTDSIAGKSYILPKKDTNSVQEFHDVTNDIPHDASTSCTLNQQQNDVQSSQKYTCVELETSPLKQSLDSYDLLSSTDLTSYSVDSSLQCVAEMHENALGVETNAECRSSKRSLRCKKSIKAKKGKQLLSSIEQLSGNELSSKRSQITVINPFSYKNIRTSYQESAPAVRISSDVKKQSRSERKQQFLLNFHEDPATDKNCSEESRVNNSRYIAEDTVSEDSNASCLSLPETKSRDKFSKTNAKANLEEKNAAAKRRRVTSTFSSNLKRNAVTSTVNQQKMQSKHLTSSGTGITCTNRRRNVTSE